RPWDTATSGLTAPLAGPAARVPGMAGAWRAPEQESRPQEAAGSEGPWSRHF
ncbi:hypothetical protein P7K49_004797, partial [Saguinus oedipus]